MRDANGLAWMVATERPELFLHEEWALAISGDPVERAVQKPVGHRGPRYHPVLTMKEPYEPVIRIYKHN